MAIFFFFSELIYSPLEFNSLNILKEMELEYFKFEIAWIPILMV